MKKGGLASSTKRESAWWLMLAAFLAYTGMYAVRKAFLAAQFDAAQLWGLDLKTVLVISQVLGYMLSKFLGIKLVSEMKGDRRPRALFLFVGMGLLMLLLFAWLPPNWRPLALFLNGLPLGMVFGLVLSYLEGRRNTELLAAALSATFIFSTGLVKTVGLWLLQSFAVSEFQMPFLTGLIFFPIFLLAIWMLSKSSAPSLEDVEARTERKPMLAADRKRFLKEHGLGFGFLVLMYVVLTIVRDIRDNFIVDFWAGRGQEPDPALLSLTEIPIAVLILIIAAAGIMFKSNYKAFKVGMLLTALCSILLILSSVYFELSVLSPVLWVILSGFALYLPYILFHTMIFERFIALFRVSGTVGFLFYVADALGYSGSVAIMLYKQFGQGAAGWGAFMIDLNRIVGIALLGLSVLAWFYVRKSRAKRVLEVSY